MPHSREWPGWTHLVHDLSPYEASWSRWILDPEEEVAAENWMARQIFLGEVLEECPHRSMSRGFRVGGYFRDARDIALFKLTWG